MVHLIMHSWLPVLIIVLILILIIVLHNRSSQRKKLASIREQWGKPKIAYRNIKLISEYLNNSKSAITANTITDLDVDNLFDYIDRTNSKPGQQYLYKKLHSPETFDSYFGELEQQITRINEDLNMRDLIQLKLSSLNNTDAYYLPALFSKRQQVLFKPIAKGYIIISPVLTLLLIISLFTIPNQYAVIALFALLITNVIIHYSNKFKILSYTHSLPQLLILNNVGKWLKKNNVFQQSDAVNKSLVNVGKLKNSLGFINIQNKVTADPTDISYLFTEWLKMFLVIEPLIFIFSISRVNKYLADIKTLYEAVAQVDMAIAIQSIRDGAPYYCKPQFTATETMEITDLYHPLIENCIPNSIKIDNKHGVLITGSNMSGKTTFIRAIALNTLLSQTIHTSFSKSYRAPLLNILTSISINDDLGENKSYFQAEALSLKQIIDNAAANVPIHSLVIIDEIFRGTNTIERIAAAKAVLTYLIENRNFVFVSTHDLELAELLGKDYKVFSFEEIIGNERLVFDYKIKEGTLKNKNGIAVLKGLGFPDSIIDEANKVSTQLRVKYQL